MNAIEILKDLIEVMDACHDCPDTSESKSQVYRVKSNAEDLMHKLQAKKPTVCEWAKFANNSYRIEVKSSMPILGIIDKPRRKWRLQQITNADSHVTEHSTLREAKQAFQDSLDEIILNLQRVVIR